MMNQTYYQGKASITGVRTKRFLRWLEGNEHLLHPDKARKVFTVDTRRPLGMAFEKECHRNGQDSKEVLRSFMRQYLLDSGVHPHIFSDEPNKAGSNAYEVGCRAGEDARRKHFKELRGD